MSDSGAPWHAHVYYAPEQRDAAAALRDAFVGHMPEGSDPHIMFVGRMADRPIGPHPIAQFEVHFVESSRPAVMRMIEPTGLRALIHPLTDDDLADHTRLADWIGAPLDLDLTVLDPPGVNQGVPRFGESDF